MPGLSKYHFLVLILLGFASINTAFTQERCGTVEYTKKLQSANPLFEREKDFENWIREKISAKTLRQKNARTQAAAYEVPVVVHIVHNGEPVGLGSNIPDAQVLSQIKVLNQDFRRENPDASNTPPEFASVAGAMDIEFVLAKRDPNGLPTTGIVRVDGNRTGWFANDNYELKALSYWPAEDYLNIWVCNFVDFIGLAQLPVSDLPGLEGSSNNRLTDGVVISHEAFGSDDDGNFALDSRYNKGRTATHEVSHFLGLRHIWGDDGGECTGSDYVSDTPNQGGHSNGCPTGTVMSCGVSSMYQNFMDYSDDRCMNLFTQQQIDRMIAVLENSPRRQSLLTSPGLLPPDPVANDLGISSVVSPTPTQCINQVSPSIQIKNFGTTLITSARIRITVNGVIIQTKDFALSLNPQETTNISFSDVSLPNGVVTVIFEILLTNGTTDGDAVGNNNLVSLQVLVPEHVSLPITENFDALTSDWIITNPDQQITWELADAPDNNAGNKALVLRFYDYEDNIGERDVLYSPIFDLTDANGAVLFFDIAHARYDFSNDELKVIAMTGCQTIDEGTLIYDSIGFKLATSASTRSYFVPGGTLDWETEFVNLDQFAGQPFVQLAFVGVNDYGNNLYLDNIFVAKSPIRDVKLNAVRSPGVVTCDSQPSPVITVQNAGTETVNSVTIQTSTSLGVAGTQTFSGLNLPAGKTVDLTVAPLSLTDGENNITFTVAAVNDATDDNSLNNSINAMVVLSNEENLIPYREDFEKGFPQWTNLNTSDGMTWQAIGTNFGTSLYFNAFNNGSIGDQAWLVSPVLDFSRTTKASLRFDLSYAARPDARETLRLMASTDCGNTYTTLDFDLPGDETSIGSWAPQVDSDWLTNELNLSQFAGQNNVRLAFVVTNANGNNLYIDNIEFFVTEEPNDVEIQSPFSLFGYNLEDIGNSDLKVGFNLPERQHVYVQVVDTMGRVIGEAFWDDVLNQVFGLPIEKQVSTGVYIVRLKIGAKVFGTRIFLNRN